MVALDHEALLVRRGRLGHAVASSKWRIRAPKAKPVAFLPLKSNWFQVLVCLVEGEQHGYGIMQDVLKRSGGKVPPSVQRLSSTDARRRYYKLTPLGRQVLDLESQRLKDLVRVLNARRRQEARS